MDSNTQCVVLVLMEMGLSFSGIVCNLLIVTTLRHEETLKGSTLNFLLLNLCFSNLLISFLVKPISAIYVGYAISTGEWQVGLAFCTLYTFTYRTTWCVFPFTIVAMCWCKLLAQCKCGLCGLLCCSGRREKKKLRRQQELATVEGTAAEMAFLDVNDHRGLHAPSPQPSHTPFTELAMQFGSGSIRHGGSLLFQTSSATRDSLSTPTPSTTTENCHQISVAGGGSSTNNEKKDEDEESARKGRKHKRTIEDGPTARQKVLVSFIWLMSAFFGVTTCFPDKVFGVEMSQKILEDQLRTIPPSLGTPRDMDLTYCTVRTGVNDLLDYIAIMVAMVIPMLVGPFIVGIFQSVFSIFSHFLCHSRHVTQLESAAAMAAGPAGAAIHNAAMQAQANADKTSAFRNALRRPNLSKGPGWGIIASFTAAFLLTYPMHMYVAEVYIADNFHFLMVKYCVGFLFVIFVPILTLVLETEIRDGIRSVFGSAVLCLQEMDESETKELDQQERQVILNNDQNQQ